MRKRRWLNAAQMPNPDMDTAKHFQITYSRELDAPRDVRYAVYSSRVWKRFLSLLPDRQARILDVGCGSGCVLYALEQAGYEKLTGCDFVNAVSNGFLAKARIHVGDFSRIGFADESFDAVVSTMVIEHVSDDQGFMQDIGKLLKPGGVTLVTSVLKKPWAWYFYRNPQGQRVLEHSHLREYRSVAEFTRLFEQWAEVILLETPSIKFPLVDHVFRLLLRLTGVRWFAEAPMSNPVVKQLRKLRVPIPGYHAIEVVIRKKPSKAAWQSRHLAD